MMPIPRMNASTIKKGSPVFAGRYTGTPNTLERFLPTLYERLRDE